MRILIERYRLICYFFLCFLIAWSIWIPVGILAPKAAALTLPGAWAPTLAALLITLITDGRAGVRALLRGLLKWRVGVGLYAFAIFGMLGLALLSVGLNVLLGGSALEIGGVAARFGIPTEQAHLFIVFAPIIFIMTIFVGGPIAEELGWRGYAQPQMQTKIGAGPAGLAIGFIWSLWHLPMFFYFPSVVGDLPIGYYIQLITVIGVLFAWLFNRSGGSVLLCILFHAGINFALGIVRVHSLTILLILTAVLALVLYRRIRLVKDLPSAGIVTSQELGMPSKTLNSTPKDGAN